MRKKRTQDLILSNINNFKEHKNSNTKRVYTFLKLDFVFFLLCTRCASLVQYKEGLYISETFLGGVCMYVCICSDIFEENALQNGFCWCLEPHLEKDSFFIFMKSSKISSKSDTQSGVDFGQIENKFLEVLVVMVLKTKNILTKFCFLPFYECNAA